MHESRRLLTVTETAQQLCCSATNVYSLIDSGLLPVVRVGNAKGYRIDPRDLDQFINERKEAKTRVGRRPTPSQPKLKHIQF